MKRALNGAAKTGKSQNGKVKTFELESMRHPAYQIGDIRAQNLPIARINAAIAIDILDFDATNNGTIFFGVDVFAELPDARFYKIIIHQCWLPNATGNPSR